MKIVLYASLLSLMLFAVWEHAEMVQLGYEIEQLKRDSTHEHKRQQALLVEYYGLVSLDRIEQLATTQLGLMRPQPGQVVLMFHP